MNFQFRILATSTLLLTTCATLACGGSSPSSNGSLDVTNVDKRRVYVGGNLNTLDGLAVNDLIRLTMDGKIDPAFDTGSGFDGYVRAVVQVPDGSGDIVVSGTFNTFNGQPASRIVRLTSTGAISPSNAFGAGFSAIPGGGVSSLHYDSQGRLYAGGDFLEYQDNNVSRFVRILPDGSQDPAFNGRITSGWISEIEVSPINDDVIVAGTFTSVETHAGIFDCERIVRFNSNGALDPDFNDCTAGSGFNMSTYALFARDPYTLFVGGFFTSYGGSGHNRIARLGYNGAAQANFDTGAGISPGFDETVLGVISAGGSDLLVHGDFSSYNQDVYPYEVDPIVRLDTNGALDETFSANLDIAGDVDAAARDESSGLIYAAGNIIEINGQSTVSAPKDLVIINPDGVLKQAISLDATSVYAVLMGESQ